MIIFINQFADVMTDKTGNLYFKSKTISLVILAATALICSRTLFSFFNDPEGPNLLIVIVLGLIIYSLSLAAYLFTRSGIKGLKRLLGAVFFQIGLVIVLYFMMK